MEQRQFLETCHNVIRSQTMTKGKCVALKQAAKLASVDLFKIMSSDICVQLRSVGVQVTAASFKTPICGPRVRQPPGKLQPPSLRPNVNSPQKTLIFSELPREGFRLFVFAPINIQAWHMIFYCLSKTRHII